VKISTLINKTQLFMKGNSNCHVIINPDTNQAPNTIEEEFKNYCGWLYKDLSTKAYGNSD
jgi:hypothetical protein